MPGSAATPRTLLANSLIGLIFSQSWESGQSDAGGSHHKVECYIFIIYWYFMYIYKAKNT